MNSANGPGCPLEGTTPNLRNLDENEANEEELKLNEITGELNELLSKISLLKELQEKAKFLDATIDHSELLVLVQDTQNIAGSVNSKIMSFKTHSPEGSLGYSHQPLIAKITRDFASLLTEFRDICNNIEKINSSKVSSKYQNLSTVELENENHVDEELKPLFNQKQAPAGREKQASRHSNSDLLFVTEREAEIREIEKGVREINEIFKQLSSIISEQGQKIELIDFNIENADVNAEEALYQLQKAENKGKRFSKLKIIVYIVILALLIIIIIPRR